MRLWLLIRLLLLIGVLNACSKTQSSSSVREFEDFVGAESNVFMVGNQPFQLQKARAAGIAHTVMKRYFGSTDDFANQYYYEVKFPSLSREQFDFLMNTYGGRGGVRYVAGRSYDLLDFVSPTIQAIANKMFKAQTQDISAFPGIAKFETPELGLLFVQTNCWSTAYEVARGDSENFAQFLGEDHQVIKVLRDPRHSSVVKTYEYKSTPDNFFSGLDTGDNQGLQLGDMLIVTDPNEQTITHAAIYLEDDLFFEKTSNFKAYRLVHYRDVTRMWKGTYVFRRFTGGKKVQLPHPRDAFSLSQKLPLFSRYDPRNWFTPERTQALELAEANAYKMLPDHLAKQLHGSLFYAGREVVDPVTNERRKISFWQLNLTQIRDLKLVLSDETGRYELEPAAKSEQSFVLVPEESRGPASQ